MSIIQGGDLWLSHLRFSNDDAEFVHGVQFVDDELKALAKASRADKERGELIRRIRSLLQEQREQAIFICCFCEQDNLLSQWRGYADNGGGVSIEFDAPGFRQLSGEDSSARGLTRLWRVVYKEESQRKIVRSAIDFPYGGSMKLDDRVGYVRDALSFFLPTFKSSGFIDEKERRLIFTPGPANPPSTRFRVRGGLVVPYVRMREIGRDPPGPTPTRLPIRRVLVGPGQYRELNRQSLRMVLDANGYDGVAVDVSNIRYRG